MKLYSIFKKDTSKEVKGNAQKLDKKQLEKVIGGTDSEGTTPKGVIATVAMDKGLK